jgi:hypothetical protein
MEQTSHIPRFTLERLQARDLSPAEETSISAHLHSCRECRQTLEALRADDGAFKTEIPYAGFRIEHERRRAAASHAHRAPWHRWVYQALAASAAAALLLFAIALPRSTDDPGVRIKGAGVALGFVVVEEGVARQGVSGEALAPGSHLQLSYDAGEFTHVAILGVDEAGAVTVYFPEAGEVLASIPSGPAGALPFSLTLDRQPGRERFVAVFARASIPVAPLVTALTEAGTRGELNLPTDVAQSTIWIEKR